MLSSVPVRLFLMFAVLIAVKRKTLLHRRRTLRLTYRRRGGRWSANRIYKSSQTAERKARAAVRCRRFVGPFHLSSHLITKRHHAALIPFDLHQMKGDI